MTQNSTTAISNEAMTGSSAASQIEINFIYKMVVFVIGCFGNVITVCVVQQITLQTVARITITILALSDLLCLISNFPVLIYPKFYHKSYFDVSNFTCKIGNFTLVFFPFLSCLMVALLTVERAVAVAFPLKVKQVLSTKKLLVSVIAAIAAYMIWVIFVAADHFIQPVHDESGSILYSSCQTANYWEAFQYTSLTLGAAVPLSVILVGNIMICIAVIRQRKTRTQLTNQNSTHNNDSQLILTTISISVAFIALTSPLAFYFAFGKLLVGEELFHDYNNVYYLTFDSIYYTNFSINFFFYVAFTKSFREKLEFYHAKFRCRSIDMQENSIESDNTCESTH